MKNIFLIFVMVLFVEAGLPLQQNVYDYLPKESFRVMCPYEFDLQGINTRYPLYVPIGLPVVWGNTSSGVVLIFKRIFVIYSEATNATDSCKIEIGIPGNRYYYHEFYSGQSKTLWQVDTINASDFTAEDRVYNDGAHNVLLVSVTGGKAGTGKIMIGAEFTRNILERQ